jgi:hypothetical protein
MPAPRTNAKLRLASLCVEMIAPNAMKGGLAPSVLEKRVVPAIIEHPKPYEDDGDH